MSKTRKLLFLCILCAVSVIISSCGKKDEVSNKPTEQPKEEQKKSVPTDVGHPELFVYDDKMTEQQNSALQSMLALPEKDRNNLATLTKADEKKFVFSIDARVAALVRDSIPHDISKTGPKFVREGSTVLAAGTYLMAGQGSANGSQKYDTLINANDWFNGKRYELFYMYVMSLNKAGDRWSVTLPSALQCNVAVVEIGSDGRIVQKKAGLYNIKWVKLEKFTSGSSQNMFKWAFHSPITNRYAFDYDLCMDRVILTRLQEQIVSRIKAMPSDQQLKLVELTPATKLLSLNNDIAEMVRFGLKTGKNNHLVFLSNSNGWALNRSTFDAQLVNSEFKKNSDGVWNLTMPVMEFGNVAMITTDDNGTIIDTQYLMPEFITDSNGKLLSFLHNHYLNNEGSVGIYFPEFGPRP